MTVAQLREALTEFDPADEVKLWVYFDGYQPVTRVFQLKPGVVRLSAEPLNDEEPSK